MKNKSLMERDKNKHLFSFYYPSLDAYAASIVTIVEPDMYHRLVTVLRYQVGDEGILFNKEHYCRAKILGITKKNITFSLHDPIKNTILNPEIVLLLPLLKKDALEEAVHNAVVAGVTAIQLVVAHKCHRRVIIPSEAQRLEKIIIAAAEQSHYYTMPEVRAVIPFADAIEMYHDYRMILADPEGQALETSIKKTLLIIGPEGGLTPEEQELVKSRKAILCALTPTILRSQDAVLVAIASLRMKQK